MRSAIYTGHVVHARRDHIANEFRYGIYFLGIDIDELSDLRAHRLRLLRHNRLAPLCIIDRDYDGAATLGLRGAIVGLLQRDGVAAQTISRIDNIELITQPRVAGYAFNPVSFFLCRDDSDQLVCAVAEVSNTYGGRHRYVLDERCMVGKNRYRSEKTFYVSPYLHGASAYEWSFEHTGEKRIARVDVYDEHGAPCFYAALEGRRRPLTDANIARLLLRYPAMTAQIISLIYWQALKVRRRGVEHQQPPPADTACR